MTPQEIADFAEGLSRIAASGGVSNEDLASALRLAGSALAFELALGNGNSSRRGGERSYWERLISGAYHDATAARDDAVARGIHLAHNYLAIAIESETNEESQALRDPSDLSATLAAIFVAREGQVGSLERGPVSIVLVPVAREIDAENARTAAVLLPKTLAKRRSGITLCGGVGPAMPALELGRSLACAQAALQIVRRLYGGGHVGIYDQLGAYPLLFEGADAGALRAFAQRILAPLRAYDDKHQTELERTLRIYFGAGQNVKTAAGELNVHRHTVFYRLRQIGEIAGCSLDTPHDQLTLRLAIAIDALHTS